MTPRLHIIASCSGRKRGRISPSLQLHAVPGETLTDRHRNWVSRLETAPDKPQRADRLYVGDHASVLLSAREIAASKKYDPRLWILSAGYGLVSESAQLLPYSATFANGDKDSISRRRDEKAEWWRLACASVAGKAGEPIDLASLVARERGSSFLFIASPRYLEAIEYDLIAAIAQGASSKLLIISSANADFEKRFGDHYLPASSDHATSLSGVLSSLHARVARAIIANDLLSEPIEALRRKFGAIPGYVRKSPGTGVSDGEVSRRIESIRREEPLISATGALRRLRTEGYACEQKRFGRLFRAEGRGGLD